MQIRIAALALVLTTLAACEPSPAPAPDDAGDGELGDGDGDGDPLEPDLPGDGDGDGEPPADLPGDGDGFCCECSSFGNPDAPACTMTTAGECGGEGLAWCEPDINGWVSECEAACEPAEPLHCCVCDGVWCPCEGEPADWCPGVGDGWPEQCLAACESDGNPGAPPLCCVCPANGDPWCYPTLDAAACDQFSAEVGEPAEWHEQCLTDEKGVCIGACASP